MAQLSSFRASDIRGLVFCPLTADSESRGKFEVLHFCLRYRKRLLI